MVRAGSVLNDAESFDAGFFELSPREAKLMDPQHRLALEAAWSLPPGQRPVVLCTRPRSDEPVPVEASVPGLPSSRTRDLGLVFDRTQTFGHRERLDYRIVVNWAIAEHKSQGTMQLLMNRGDEETYLLFEGNDSDAEERARALFEELQENPFPTREYSSSAGTNATTR